MFNRVKQGAQQAAGKAFLRLSAPNQRGIILGLDIRNSLNGQPALIFDVGAHRGESLDEFTKWFPQARVHCFEPSSDAFAALRRRAARNPRVTCVNVALGDAAGEATLYIRLGTDNNSLSDYSGQHKLEEVLSTEIVAVDTLDSYASAHGIRRIDLLKIDTEGLDLKVLSGGRAMFDSQSIGIVQVEAAMSPENTKHVARQEFEEFFEKYRYRLFGIYDQVEEWPTSRPFLRRSNLVFISPKLAMI